MTIQEKFAQELAKKLSVTHSASKKDVFHLGGWFTNILKSVIDAVGLGDMTKEEFLALVSTAYDTLTAPMGIPPMLNSMIKAAVLAVAGRIYDKRKSVPVPAV